ncbi:hypothetical protein BM221_010529 [Beauveria bassiana]|uniref:Uncharacterized protein n=1 Tax=Beauveria bassiana TaxID=176275 RepID=A0A2N6N8N3_BEABA|nr:hypothetical protein BM221_010529 [Beauveria bassiana]
MEHEDFDTWGNIEDEYDDQEEEPLGKMLRSGPTTRNIHPLCQRRKNLDERGDSSTKPNNRELL